MDSRTALLNIDVFPLGTFISPLGIELSIHMSYRHQIALIEPQEVHSDFRCLPLSPLLSEENLHLLYFFAHILVSPASAIEVQHCNESSFTVHLTSRTRRSTN